MHTTPVPCDFVVFVRVAIYLPCGVFFFLFVLVGPCVLCVICVCVFAARDWLDPHHRLWRGEYSGERNEIRFKHYVLLAGSVLPVWQKVSRGLRRLMVCVVWLTKNRRVIV